MVQYIWQRANWPGFTWSNGPLIRPLARCRLVQGKLLGKMSLLTPDWELEAHAALLTEEAVRTARIEGQILDRDSVRSSVARHLGLDAAGLPAPERHADGMVQVLIDATRHYDQPLTPERLKGWQAALFPTGYSGLCRITVGDWRGPSPMRIVSGPVGREKVHYEAPPPDRIETEMRAFLDWWEHSSDRTDGILRAGIAHLYFITIHPFEDGNGRIARAITDMAMARDEGSRKRFYSMSAQIQAKRNAYYEVLEKTQKGSGDITEWLVWFLGCLEGAILKAGGILETVLAKSLFWKDHAQTELSPRQIKAINRLLDAGKGGFKGGLTTRKYMSMTKTSRATAQRDIQDLCQKGILRPGEARGRSTHYDLVWPEVPISG